MKYESIFKEVELVLQSKVNEFTFLSYDTLTTKQIWSYCVDKKWRKKNIEQLRLYEIVQTIFSLTPSEIVSYLDIQSKSSINGSLVSLDTEEMEVLLGPSDNYKL